MTLSPSLDPTLIETGKTGTAEAILAAARQNICGEYVIAALWEGATRRMQATVAQGLNQKTAVLDAALSGPPFPFVSHDDLAHLLVFAGRMGEDWHIVQAAARAQGREPLVQALLNGAALREKEHLASGIRRKHTICHSVVANLPPHRLTAGPAMETVLECMAKIGSEDEIFEIAKRYGHDSDIVSLMVEAAAAAERADRQKAGLAELVQDVFARTTVLSPAPTVAMTPGVHPLGLKKSTLRL